MTQKKTTTLIDDYGKVELLYTEGEDTLGIRYKIITTSPPRPRHTVVKELETLHATISAILTDLAATEEESDDDTTDTPDQPQLS
jgi:hypothetical protein